MLILMGDFDEETICYFINPFNVDELPFILTFFTGETLSAIAELKGFIAGLTSLIYF